MGKEQLSSLIEQLNAPTKAQRLEALAGIRKLVDQGEIEQPMRGQDVNRRGARLAVCVCPDGADGVPTAGAGHADVHQDEIEPLAVCARNALLSTFRLDDIAILILGRSDFHKRSSFGFLGQDYSNL